MTQDGLPRGPGDIQTAVVNLVERLAPIVPLTEQPSVAHRIATVIAGRPSAMRNDMFLRQSIIRGGIATPGQVIDGIASWVTVLFDLGNLRHDRRRALDVTATLPDEALCRLTRSLARSRNGCILAVPHIGSIELFAAHLRHRGYTVGFVYTISSQPTPTEQWIYQGRSATGCTPIAFGRRNTGAEIARVLQASGVVFMVVDVYPSAKYSGIHVRMHDADFNFPPGPARYAQTGTLVLPGFASRRDASGFSMQILDPLDAHGTASDFTQSLAVHIGAFTALQPAAYWLWHPIPNDPFHAVARRQRPDLLALLAATNPDDEATALAVEAIDPQRLACGVAALAP